MSVGDLAEIMATLGSVASVDDHVDFEEILDPCQFYCLPRDDAEAGASAMELTKAGYKVIREDASFTVYAPRDGCPTSERLDAKVRLKLIRVKPDVTRNVHEANVECGCPVDSFSFSVPLPQQPGQSVRQELKIEGTLRTFKVKDSDKSEWARVEVTSLQWSISPGKVTDKRHFGYFVDSIELCLIPTWENPQASARHGPAIEYVAVNETKMVQNEKKATFSLSLSKAFGATVGGGKKWTKGSGTETVRNPCKEHWDVISDEGGSINTCYRWFLNYWEGEEAASSGPQDLESRSVLVQFPSVPNPTMLAKKASVDWIWPNECEQPPAWNVTIKARVVFLYQVTEKKLFRIKSLVKIVPSIMFVEPEEFRIEYRPMVDSLVSEKYWPYFIFFLALLLAGFAKFLKDMGFTTEAEHQLHLS